MGQVLQKHRWQKLAIETQDVMSMMAELRHSSRQAVLTGVALSEPLKVKCRDALSAWFAYATGLPVLEVGDLSSIEKAREASSM